VPVNTLRLKGKELFRRSWRARCSGSLISRCAPLSQIANEIMRARHYIPASAKVEVEEAGERHAFHSAALKTDAVLLLLKRFLL
jgi:hypothetical protein